MGSLSFGLWSHSSPAYWDTSRVIAAANQLKAGSCFSSNVHILADAIMELFVTQSRFRLQLVAVAVADGDEVIREAMVEHYHGALKARKLRLRPGLTADDFVNLLAAVAEGTALRQLAEPATGILDRDNGRSLLG